MYADLDGPENGKGEDGTEYFSFYSLTTLGQAIALSEYAIRIAAGSKIHAVVM